MTFWDFQTGLPRFSIQPIHQNISHIDFMELTEIERIESSFVWDSGITTVLITSSGNYIQFWNWKNGSEVYRYEFGRNI